MKLQWLLKSCHEMLVNHQICSNASDIINLLRLLPQKRTVEIVNFGGKSSKACISEHISQPEWRIESLILTTIRFFNCAGVYIDVRLDKILPHWVLPNEG